MLVCQKSGIMQTQIYHENCKNYVIKSARNDEINGIPGGDRARCPIAPVPIGQTRRGEDRALPLSPVSLQDAGSRCEPSGT